VSIRIGERLVEEGLITTGQLDRALKAQLIFGGHLGTSLIELGFLEEDQLGGVLAEIHRVRHATREMLQEIPEEVLTAIPPDMVERNRVVPFKADLKKKTIHVAVIEPRDVPPISCVRRFKTIVPWIAPEIRILQAMEQHYGIQRRPRYINICHELERTVPDRRKVPDRREVPDRRGVNAAAGETGLGPDGARVSKVRVTATTTDIGAEYGYGKSWREVADGLFGEAPAPGGGEATVPPEPPPGDTPRSPAPPGLAEAAERMSRAETKDELAAAVLDHLAAEATGCILFGVRTDVAQVWDWRGFDFDLERARGLRFPVTSGSIFTLLLGNESYRGPVPDEPGVQWFFGALGLDRPREILLLPVYVNDRLVAILYADGGTEGRLELEDESCRLLSRKLSMAMNMLILKIKIRAT
jgi:hypothetical protein